MNKERKKNDEELFNSMFVDPLWSSMISHSRYNDGGKTLS